MTEGVLGTDAFSKALAPPTPSVSRSLDSSLSEGASRKSPTYLRPSQAERTRKEQEEKV
jgi:hypothetical protein